MLLNSNSVKNHYFDLYYVLQYELYSKITELTIRIIVFKITESVRGSKKIVNKLTNFNTHYIVNILRFSDFVTDRNDTNERNR